MIAYRPWPIEEIHAVLAVLGGDLSPAEWAERSHHPEDLIRQWLGLPPRGAQAPRQRRGGRPRALNPVHERALLAMLGRGFTRPQVALRFGIGLSTVDAIVRRARRGEAA